MEFLRYRTKIIKIKSAVMAPKPTNKPLLTDDLDLSTIIAVIGPGGAAIEMPRDVPARTVNIVSNYEGNFL